MQHIQRGVPRRRRESGAGLVLIMGVVAALAISAATLVVLTANIQHNTADTRTHVKSFSVAEGGLDAGMALLTAKWPRSSTSTATFDWTTFRGRFTTSEFPDPPGGPSSFISVTWYDNQDGATPDKGIKWDKGGPGQGKQDTPDGKLWLVSQANVGSRSTRLVSLVELKWLDMSLPRGMPLWAGGNLLSNGLGNNPKIWVEVPPPDGTLTSVQVGGSIEESSVTADGITQITGSKISPLESVFPQSLVDALRSTAQLNARYFTSLSAAEASPVDAVWSPSGGLSGLTVIEPAPATDVKLTGNIVLNSVDLPGILLVLGGSELQWGGTGQFYGVIYSEGGMDTSAGTADIHGMVITAGTESMKGTPNIIYNDKCIASLDNRFPSLVRRVQNTWREVQPK